MTDARSLEPAEVSSSPSLPSCTDKEARSQLQARIQKHRGTHDQEFVLDVDFQAASGFTILFGPSGAGKTTLLDCIAGLVTPDQGRITVGNSLLFDAARSTDRPSANLPVSKRRVGYVFQSLALFPHLTVEQNVEYGLAHLSQPERKQRVSTILQAFRIPHLAHRSAREISGGESQRAALARTLVTDPSVLLLDAPTKSRIIDDLRDWNRAHRIPILYVTHSREEVFALGERVIVLDAGRIVAQGTPHEVLTAPVLETVAQLAGFENVFDVSVEAVHPERGTMLCRIVTDPLSPSRTDGTILLETPLVRCGVGAVLRVGIRAGDILLATVLPVGLSARNVIPGTITSLEQHDVIVSANVNCGVEVEVHLTLAARDSLQLAPGGEVWLVIKTHSCHL